MTSQEKDFRRMYGQDRPHWRDNLEQVGHCPHCGAPLYTLANWSGGPMQPPPVTYLCACRLNNVRQREATLCEQSHHVGSPVVPVTAQPQPQLPAYSPPHASAPPAAPSYAHIEYVNAPGCTHCYCQSVHGQEGSTMRVINRRCCRCNAFLFITPEPPIAFQKACCSVTAPSACEQTTVGPRYGGQPVDATDYGFGLTGIINYRTST